MKISYFGFFALLFFASVSSSTSQIQTYEGKFSLNAELYGYAIFDYVIMEGDTIYEGDFMFESIVDSSDYQEGVDFQKIEIQGKYKQNKKYGQWTFSHQKLSREDRPVISKHEIRYLTHGESFNVIAFFENGVAEKKWKVIHQRIENSKPTDTLFFAQKEFSKGLPDEQFYLKSKSHTISGSFADKGLMDGQWKINYFHTDFAEPLGELRNYAAGALTSHRYLIGKKKVVIPHPSLIKGIDESDHQQWEIMDYGDLYVDVFCQSLSISDSGTFVSQDSLHRLCEKGTLEFIKADQFFESYKDIDFWEITGGSEPIEKMKVFVLRHFYTDAEKEEFIKSRELLRNAKSIFKNYFENAEADISKFSSEEMAFNDKLMSIYQERVDKIYPLFFQCSLEALEYLGRKKLISDFAVDVSYPDTLKVKFKGEQHTKAHSFPSKIEKAEATYQDYHLHVKNLHTDLIKIETKIKNILKEYRKQNILSEKESELVAKKDTLKQLYSGKYLEKKYNSYHNHVSQMVEEVLNTQFREYSELTTQEKIDQIDSVFHCYNEFDSAYHILAEIPYKIKNFDESYIREVWSPHTYTDMEERVKPRLFKVFLNDLLPYYTDMLIESSDCNELMKRVKAFEFLFQRMSALRSQDTKSMERQLRRADSIHEILEILSLKGKLN